MIKLCYSIVNACFYLYISLHENWTELRNAIDYIFGGRRPIYQHSVIINIQLLCPSFLLVFQCELMPWAPLKMVWHFEIFSLFSTTFLIPQKQSQSVVWESLLLSILCKGVICFCTPFFLYSHIIIILNVQQSIKRVVFDSCTFSS